MCYRRPPLHQVMGQIWWTAFTHSGVTQWSFQILTSPQKLYHFHWMSWKKAQLPSEECSDLFCSDLAGNCSLSDAFLFARIVFFFSSANFFWQLWQKSWWYPPKFKDSFLFRFRQFFSNLAIKFKQQWWHSSTFPVEKNVTPSPDPLLYCQICF